MENEYKRESFLRCGSNGCDNMISSTQHNKGLPLPICSNCHINGKRNRNRIKIRINYHKTSLIQKNLESQKEKRKFLIVKRNRI